jgi:hypothetical protein
MRVGVLPLLLLLLLASTCDGARLPINVGGRSHRDRDRDGNRSPRGEADEAQALRKAVDSRTEPANQTLAERIENWTASHPMLKGPQRAILKGVEWLRDKNPGLWLMLATVLVTHKRGRSEKEGELAALRGRLELGEDFHIAIVTTAALPWMTGTAVNPLLRAAHLSRARKRVTLMVPWVHPLEQAMIFPKGVSFESPEAQAEYMRTWLEEKGGLRAPDLRLAFYPGRYDAERGSILPLGDITRFFDASER